MKIGTVFIYMVRIPKIAFWKIRYANKIKIESAQNFSLDTRIIIKNNGKMSVGMGLQSRRNLQMIADGGDLSVGRSCFFNANCSITCLDNITIGSGCSFGNNLVIVDHDHNYKHQTKGSFLSAPVKIGNNVWIGANCVILSGTTIGDECIIAAGSVVKSSVDSGTLLYQERKNILRQI
jgi:acetyltransferase-like isoleucine patch superfamily enzyme